MAPPKAWPGGGFTKGAVQFALGGARLGLGRTAALAPPTRPLRTTCANILGA